MNGHIRERRPGVWQVMFDIDPDPVTGRRRQRSRTIHGTQAEAEQLLEEITTELDAGGFVDDGSMRVSDFVDMFIDARRQRWSPSTEAWYRSKLKHLIAACGHRKLTQVTPAVLTVLYSRLLDEGLSGSSVAAVHRASRAMFRAAVKWGYLRQDPTDRAEAPRSETPEMETWTADQLRQFFAATIDDRWHLVWVLAAMTGMRRGELAGLEWGRVDLKGQSITVTKSVTTVAGKAVEGGPKTRAGRRTISIDRVTVDVLRSHRIAQMEQRMRAGDAWVDSGRVFCWDDGRAVNPDIWSKAFRRTVDRLELPRIRLHDLRHGWATLAVEAGVHIRVVADRLGHANPSVTLNVYSHTRDELDRQAAEAVADLVHGQQGGQRADETGTDPT